MCDFEQGFILCTCENKPQQIVHNKHSRRYKNSPKTEEEGYRWFLSSFVNTFEPMMEGSYEPPSRELGGGLTEEWVLLHLNYGNCFDFDYTPSDGDNLVIRPANSYKYMSFIFRKGEWVSDRYDGFSTILELRLKGEIKPISTEEA